MTQPAASRPAIEEPVIRAKRSCGEADARPTSAPTPNAAPTSRKRELAIPARYRGPARARIPVHGVGRERDVL